jgi:colanic acid biosynthesis protein WcaH
MTLTQAIEIIEQHIDDPHIGLPQDVFYLMSRLTPLVNVDLLIKDQDNRVLLAWRQDKFAGAGWHIPGGIVRYKETLAQRIDQVAITEIGQKVNFNPEPVTINEIHRPHASRGHFISFLYICSIEHGFIPDNSDLKKTDPGYLQWHDRCPDNLIEVHELYRKYIENDQIAY